MDRWMDFAVQRKRQLLLAGAAGIAFLALLAPVSRHALAKTYVITDGQRVVTYTTFATDPAEVLGEAGVDLDAYDTYYAGGSDIQICRAQRIRLWVYGQEQIVSSQGETVAQLLSRLGIDCTGEDKLSHDPDMYTWDGLELRLDRIQQRQETYTTTVAHEVVTCYDSSLPEGTREVLVGGVDGELLCTAEVTYTNFRETERKLLSQTMTIAPVTEIVAVGTGEARQPPDPQAMPEIGDGYIRLPTGEVLTYYKTDTVRATAYTHTDAGCDLITYTGTRVRMGTVAVDPRFIPYGTRMFIVSNDGCYIYGIGVAEDCGGAIKRDRIDLYFPTYEECMQFGRRSCTIYFLG